MEKRKNQQKYVTNKKNRNKMRRAFLCCRFLVIRFVYFIFCMEHRGCGWAVCVLFTWNLHFVIICISATTDTSCTVFDLPGDSHPTANVWAMDYGGQIFLRKAY